MVVANLGTFADTIFKQKYAQRKDNGQLESWNDCARRVVGSVMAPYAPRKANAVEDLVIQRKLMPAGRYLYCAGRRYAQTNNCFLFKAEDSREGWADLLRKVTSSLMTGGGIGIVYSPVRPSGTLVGGMGGQASGPIALMEIVNEVGRRVRQGGSRRSAIWAGLHWDHADIMAYCSIKDWPKWVVEQKAIDFNTPAPMDGTNISVILDDEFFRAYGDSRHEKHSLAQRVYWHVVHSMCKTGEPGFSIDIGENAGENERNACVTGDTPILTRNGYAPIEELVQGGPVEIWNGEAWSFVQPRITGYNQEVLRVTLSDGSQLTCTPEHKFLVLRGGYADRVEVRVEASALTPGDRLSRYNMPVIEAGEPMENAYSHGFYCGDGFDYEGEQRAWLYASKNTQAVISSLDGHYREDVSQGRGHVTFATMPAKFAVPFQADLASKLEWLAGLLDADGSIVRNPNSTAIHLCSINLPFLREVRLLLTTMGCQPKIRTLLDAGDRPLPDGKGGSKDYFCQKSYRLQLNASDVALLVKLGLHTRRLKIEQSSPQRDARRFVTVEAVEPAGVADTVYCFNEPLAHRGTFNGIVTGQCTEVTSRTDSDVCNLASLNMARFKNLDEFAAAIPLSIGFLLCNTLYSQLPLEEMKRVRDVNRRLGLGLMGMHEWLLLRGKPYGPDEELASWLDVYAVESEKAARAWARRLEVNVPIATRAIAPTGTIAILAETTSGIEPIFASAYKRRYLKGDIWHAQYVIDAAAQRVVEAGVAPEAIEDAYDLAADVERRIAFQAFVQKYVDMGISSTINLPAWGSPHNCESTVTRFGEILMQYLPKLRGITTYPDGSRGGQPLNKVPYSEAVTRAGVEFAENGNEAGCVSGVCGI